MSESMCGCTQAPIQELPSLGYPGTFLTLLFNLKKNKRTGWINHRVPYPESIADHMYRMAIASFFAPPGIDATKCMAMSLVHDIAEAITGDITPSDTNHTKASKALLEQSAMESIRELIGPSHSDISEKILSLWKEYEERKTPEARFVKDLDRYEMLLQALEYEKEHPSLDLSTFFQSVPLTLNTPQVTEWTERLRSLHTQLTVQQESLPLESSPVVDKGVTHKLTYVHYAAVSVAIFSIGVIVGKTFLSK